MGQVITYKLNENFIEKISSFLCENFLTSNRDLSKVACVFGGRRPSLFLKRKLREKIKRPFYPPRIFSVDEFVEYILSPSYGIKKISELEAAYLIYTLVQKHLPSLLKGRAGFDEFLPWAVQISSFIEQLDLEDIPAHALLHIEKSAAIGYEVPHNVNVLLQNIARLREAYHQTLKESNIYCRGFMYLVASRVVSRKEFDEFDVIIFCNFFYLHTTEQRIIKEICRKGKGICIFQGSEDEWSVLKDNARNLGFPIKIEIEDDNRRAFSFSLYQGFDIHSQVGIVREILKGIEEKDDTVIVLPRPEALIPLLTEVSSILNEFNVSLGYPLTRSALYSLFEALLKVQESRKGNKYYTKHYLNLLRHPLVKNLTFTNSSTVTRVMVHKIEELLQGREESSLGGSLFLTLEEIEEEEKIYFLTSQTLKNMEISVSTDECKFILERIHNLFFRKWKEVTNFYTFANAMGELLHTLVEKSMLSSYPLNFKVIDKLFSIKEEFQSSLFSRDKFAPNQIWKIFRQKLQGEVIPFIGSPLRGTQILGIFETRALSFKNVIILDVNESILPKLKIYEPLIPREVMLNLGINRLEKEEEIQRYYFMRLIASAQNVHIVYEENKEKERSRFIEELLWEEEKKAGKPKVIPIPKASFLVKVNPYPQRRVKKTKEMIKFLEEGVYSATKLDTYLICPLRFYYQYVLGLKEKEELLQEPESAHIGRFLHQLLEETFKKFKGRKPVIDKKFREEFHKIMEEKFERELSRRMKTDAFLLKRVIANRLDKFLDNEIKRDIFKIISLEEKQAGEIVLNNQPISFTYTIDRIDQLEDKRIMVIDYKTGGMELVPERLAILENMEMSREAIKENIKSFQLPIYYYFVSQAFPEADVNAQLYNLRTLERKTFIHEVDYPHKERIINICIQAIEYIFREMLALKIPFTGDKEERKCQYCAYGNTCG